MEIDHQQPGYADGNVYEENVSPIEIAKELRRRARARTSARSARGWRQNS
jgi:hypothetical protein